MTSVENNETTGRPRRGFGRWWWRLVLLLVVVAAAGAWPGYRWWVKHRTEEFRAHCEVYREARDWQKLEAAAREWLAFDKTNGDAWLFLGSAAEEQGDFKLAADCLDRIPDDHPQKKNALLVRIDLLMQQDRALEAESTALEVLEHDSSSARAYKVLIFLSAMTLRRQRMVRHIRDAIEKGCEPPDAYVYLFNASSLRFSDGERLNANWLQATPESEIFQVAKAYYRAQSDGKTTLFEPELNLHGRTDLIDKCLKQFPHNLEVLAFHLQQSIDAGNAERVGQLLSQAPKEAREDSRFWAARGWLETAQNKWKEAENSYRRAVRHDRYNWRAWHSLAAVMRRQNRPKEAAAAAKLAALGKSIEREMMELPRANAITGPILAKMAEYARHAGDSLVRRSISKRIGRPLLAPIFNEPISR